MLKKETGFIAYGYGNYGKECSKCFFENGADVIAFADKNPMLWGEKTIEGYKIISPEEIKTFGFDVPVKICIIKDADIAEQEIRAAGFIDVNNVNIKLNADFIKKVRSSLADDLSKKVFDACIKFWESSNTTGFADVFTPDRYFPNDIIKIKENEVFIDGGGYDGNDTQKFIDLTNGSFKHIYTFEPIQKMTSICKERFSLNTKVSVLQAALGSDFTNVFFDENGPGSKENAKGNEAVRVVKLDEMTIFAPTMVKLDVEGSELDALEGMKKTIAEHKPKLAVCLYHKPLDILEIPLWIAENYPFYKLYMRKHNPTNTEEMLLYCVTD